MPKLRPLKAGTFAVLPPIALRGLGPRRVRAYIPAPRKDDGPRPVVILFDGQNVFTDEGSFAGGWFVHEIVDKVARWKPTPPLVVAIDHGNEKRIDELSPFSDGKRGGKLSFVIDALVSQLLPRLHSRFDLVYGPGGHFLAGSSLGGLAALYTHLRRPDVFGGAIAMSPSLWFTRDKVEAFIESRPIPAHSRIYLTAGMREGDGTIARLVRVVGAHLRTRGWRPVAEKRERRLVIHIDPKGRHNERAWRKRFPKALRFVCEP